MDEYRESLKIEYAEVIASRNECVSRLQAVEGCNPYVIEANARNKSLVTLLEEVAALSK